MSSSTLISRRWLWAYLIALVCSIAVGWIYARYFEPETRFWLAAFQERREELGRETAKFKVIFTGDSSCSFGIDATRFTEASGQASYNLGGTRQMGMRVFMDESLKHAQRGDLLVLIANPTLFVSEAKAQQRYSKAGARMALALNEGLKVAEFIEATRPGFNHLMSLGGKFALRMPSFRYGTGDRRARGLIVTSGRDHPEPTSESFEITGPELAEVKEVLRAWGKCCAEKGVNLCYLLPIELTDSSLLEKNREAKEEFLNELEKTLSGVRILRTARMGCSDEEELFADTLFHFTQEGATDFTERLLPVLEEHMQRF